MQNSKSKTKTHKTSILMDLITAIVTAIVTAVAIALIIAMAIKSPPTKLEEPVMERSRAKGKMALGRRDYGSSDVTTVAQQETVRE